MYDITFTIEGNNTIDAKAFQISQSINEHHTFEVVTESELLKKGSSLESPFMDNVSSTKTYVGKSITIVMKLSGTNGNGTKFKGLITDVVVSLGIDGGEDITIKGYSPTILLDNNKGMKMFQQMSCRDIINKVMNPIPSNLLTKDISPKNKTVFTNMVQYHESDFEFIRRMAAENGDWFYYDGEKLQFGEPGGINTVSLEYGKTLLDFSSHMGITPLGMEESQYELTKKEFLADSKKTIPGLDTWGTDMQKASNSLFAGTPMNYPRYNAADKGQFVKYVEARIGRKGSEMVTVQGCSDNPDLHIGMYADIKLTDSSFGKVFITSIIHKGDTSVNYRNYFVGIPSAIKVLPNPYDEKPYAYNEFAIVTNNNDPENRGRVKVKFPWSKDSESLFIPVNYPAAGNGKNNSVNQGFIFTPEVNDEVIVSYENGDPNRPFVSGSFGYKEMVRDKKHTSKNLEKTIATRHSLFTFIDGDSSSDDMSAEWLVKDKDTASIKLSNAGSKGHATLITKNDIEITTADEMKITVSQGKLTIKANDIMVEAVQSLKMKGQSVSIESQTTLDLKATTDMKLEANAQMSMKANAGVTIESSAKVEVKSTGMMDLSAAKLSVKAQAMLELEGSAVAMLKGGVVMIN